MGLSLRGTPATSWRRVKLGAGGQLTGIDIANDGTKVVKADVYNGYLLTPGSSTWLPLLTLQNGAAVIPNGTAGVWDVAIAPSKTDRILMVMKGYTYRRDGHSNAWIKTAFPQLSGSTSGGNTDSNGSFKFWQNKIIVDPNNPDVVYLGTNNNGVQVSFDAGITAAAVASVTASTTGPGASGMAFDYTSGTTSVSGQTRTNKVYLTSYGNGVWVSADGGQTWTQIADGTTGPKNVRHAKIGPDGSYICYDGVAVWRYVYGTPGSWTTILTTASCGALVVDTYSGTANPHRLIVVDVGSGGKNGRETLDYTAATIAWLNNDTWAATYPSSPSRTNVATDIPWLAGSDQGYMTCGDMKIDPTNGNIYFAEGIGVWYANWPQSFTGFHWTSISLGIEELVANDVIAPLGAKPHFAVWDRSIMRSDDYNTYPSFYLPVDGSFSAGWHLDYASSDPTFIGAVSNWGSTYCSGYSSSSGQNWQTFGGNPGASQGIGGCIAVSSPTNMVWLGGNNAMPYYTLDGGQTWNACSGLPNNSGFINAYYLRSCVLAADRVNIGTFYIFNYNSGVYKSTDGGANWALVKSGVIQAGYGFAARLRCLPGTAGDVWYSADPGTGATCSLMRSQDAGGTWATINSNLTKVKDFAFGKPLNSSYPVTLFASALLSGAPGIFRSNDLGATFTKIGEQGGYNADGFDAREEYSADGVKCIGADMNEYGTCFVGYQGSGFVVGRLPFAYQ